MDTRLTPGHHGRPIRQAHPRSRHHRLADSTVLLVGLLLLGALTLGTALGAGVLPAAGSPQGGGSGVGMAAGTSPAPAPSVSSASAAPAPAASALAPTPAPGSPAAAITPSVVPSTFPSIAAPATHRGSAVDAATAVSAVAALVPRRVAAFLGDSYTTGWAGAGTGRRGWPAIVSAAHRWTVVNRAVAGTGFVNPGWTGQPIRTRVAAVLRARPGIVFVAGGHNDNRYGARATARAADAVLRRLRRGLPDAVIVVIGPIWGNGSPPATIRGIRNELRRSAGAVGAIFVDPIRDGWFAGSARRLILADGIHPSNAGHRRIAALVLAALAAQR